MTQIYHAHLYGTRDSKYDWLQTHDVLSTDWQELKPQAPFYLLIPQNTDLLSEYERGWKITDVMPTNAVGFQTHRDYLVISFSKEELLGRIYDFVNPSNSDAEIRIRYFSSTKNSNYPLGDTRDWSLSQSRKQLQQIDSLEKWITVCIRRPFDFQWYFYHPAAIDYGRPAIMNQLILRENFALLWTRPMSPNYEFSVLSASCAVDQSVVGNKTAGAGGTYVAPLYLYANIESPNPILSSEQCQPNLSFNFLNDLVSKLGYTPIPEAIFYYIYAVFHSPTYRSRYAEFLKIDFPRVPLTSRVDLFQQLATHGEALVNLHLMKSPGLEQLITQFEGSDRTVDPGHPKYANGKVTINKRGAGFTGVPEAVWNFYVGGYQVCHKWLKDRKGRTLSPEDITHYQRIVVALQETIRLMQQIDAAIPGWPLE